ncbi:formylmethionine deformylase [Pseudarthrobacter chlorophenolicus A6]|uniref:Peptide deformylase n=1 Tax=Pseudarthrobacter chlorophenolicus (strain ATCC 700700 / DSM 12829 / CIP 107037 / JCM 12360 / KCTC 9906 / NCIMB 13794 / A6) TaxID=452863 RepID=B8H8N2_PSECP|nr:peptide deformylase [Pseudarthrobacter chlorophenolicus]ACL39910.1 formylmethionine deformylase [Pseudarthrobacter chlorophenolicus A6]SDQ91480.1 peptide deformylase [Pseudarthrobacter chlorophenolicus]
MTFPAPSTDLTAEQIRETVDRILSAGTLPPIVQAGHPALRQKAAPFDGQITPEQLARLIELMRQVMHEAPGVGLAAPQLGIPLQLAVLEDKYDVDHEAAALRNRAPLDFLAILNPSYTPAGPDRAAFYEGCLSLNGLQAVVSRPQAVLLDFVRPDGGAERRGFSGWQARIVQHETDHLNGILYVDRAQLRSLSSNAEYAAHWAEPGIGKAREGLGFDDGPAGISVP